MLDEEEIEFIMESTVAGTAARKASEQASEAPALDAHEQKGKELS